MIRPPRTVAPWATPVALLVLSLLLAAPAPAPAQVPRGSSSGSIASPYLPLDHWAYPALELWIGGGAITSLSPMTRPYRIVDVVEAVARLRSNRLSITERELRERILTELSPGYVEPSRALRVDLGFEAGGRYVSQTHPDPLQPVLDGRFGDDRLFESFAAEARAAAPYVAGAATLRHYGLYRHDPRFPGGRVTPPRDGPFLDENLSLRLEQAYVELQVPYVRLSFGRLDREWGPAPIHGFLRSANPYSQDELAYRFGSERIFLVGTISAPGDFGGDTVRHLSMHRLEVRPSDRLAVAISEAVVYGGPGGRFRFELANPVGIWQLALDDDDVAYNKLGQLDAWWRAASGLALNGSLLADATGGGRSCCQMGGSLGLELTRLAPGLRVGAQVSALQSQVYRTFRPWEEYSVDGVGLGWDKSDLVLASLEADWFAAPSLLLRPRLDLQRKGEGDFRRLRPSPEELADQPEILTGVVETTLRPALAGRWSRPGTLRLDVEWDLGLSLISDYAHTEGDDRTAFTGTVAVRLRSPRWLFRVD